MLLLSLLFITYLSIARAETPETTIVWHWEDEFSSAEQQKVEAWLNQVNKATEATLGVYPFDLHFFIHRRDNSSEPVPWASTRRHELQGVDFHIDPTFSLQDFLNDWTAPHEISHLSIPFLGRDQSWFAEGYASFMQYQIMQSMGICSEEEVKSIYAGKIDRCKAAYNRDEDFISVARELGSKRRYPDMYWGGASFFMKVDSRLKTEQNQTLIRVIKEYLFCCRMDDESFSELIGTWDEILGETLFNDELHKYQTAPAKEILPNLD